jgi:hypothetical protein
MKGRSLGAALITGGMYLVAAFAAPIPDLKAARLDNAVRERQPVLTELGPNVSAMTFWVSGAMAGTW